MVLLTGDDNATQITWLSIDYSNKSSVKNLSIKLLAVIDELLGTDYLVEIKIKNNSFNCLLILFIDILAKYHLGTLIISNIQNMGKGRYKDEVLYFIQRIERKDGISASDTVENK